MNKTITLRTATLTEQAAVPFAYLRAECRAECTVTLDIRPMWSLCGRAMTFAATVTAAPPGDGVPTGTVTFRADAGSSRRRRGHLHHPVRHGHAHHHRPLLRRRPLSGCPTRHAHDAGLANGFSGTGRGRCVTGTPVLSSGEC